MRSALAWLVLGAGSWLLAACASPAAEATPSPAATRPPSRTPSPTETPSPVPSASPTRTPTPDLSGTTGITVLVMETGLGRVVVDGDRNRAVYVYGADPPGRATCTGSCATLWPPLLTEGFPQAGDGVAAGLLGYIALRDGTFQVTYANQPLYGYAGDLNPGSTLGHGISNIWFAIRGDGRRVN